MGIVRGLGKIGRTLFGRRQKHQQVPTFTPEQIQMVEQLLSQAQPFQQQSQDYYQQLLSGDPEALRAFQAPIMRQFEEEILPGIAERFTGMMGEGSERSSGFLEAMRKGNIRLQELLGAQRAQLAGGAAQQGLQQYQNLLSFQQQPRFDFLNRPGTTGIIPPLIGSAAEGAMKGLGFSGTSQFGGRLPGTT